MLLELNQKQPLIEREAKITETKVIYRSVIFGREFEVSVPYEDLSRDKETYIKTIQYSNVIIGILSFFTFVSLLFKNDKDFDNNAWMFWAALLTVAIAAYILTREVLWKVRVQNNTYLFFFKEKPDKETVNEFIETLFETRDKYLRETYFFEATKNLPYESQKNNIQWLRRIGAINRDEFQGRKDELDEMFNLEIKKIGFN